MDTRLCHYGRCRGRNWNGYWVTAFPFMARIYGTGRPGDRSSSILGDIRLFYGSDFFRHLFIYVGPFENQKKHVLLLIPVALGASFSAVFITMVNSFMNSPNGFELVNGQLVDVSPVLAMFTHSMPTKVAHVLGLPI